MIGVSSECPIEFKWIGHQEQYIFDEEVEDCLEATLKLAPMTMDKNFLHKALDKLKEG